MIKKWKEYIMNELPKRKSLRLKDFDYSNSGAYFITICTKDMKCILSRICDDETEFVGADIIRTRLSKYGVVVDKAINDIENHYDNIIVDNYVIMPNHIHIILIIRNQGGRMVSAPTVIGSLKRYVSKQIGEHIWQKGFYDHIIRNEEDYLYHIQYIDENPKKWLLGKDEYYS